jgi:hypothetical protein
MPRDMKVAIVKEMLNYNEGPGQLEKAAITPIVEGINDFTWKRLEPQTILGERTIY